MNLAEQLAFAIGRELYSRPFIALYREKMQQGAELYAKQVLEGAGKDEIFATHLVALIQANYTDRELHFMFLMTMELLGEKVLRDGEAQSADAS